MRRVVIVIVLFIICVTVSWYSLYRVGQMEETITGYVTDATQALIDGDRETLLDSVDALSEYWDEEEIKIIYFIRHAQIDELTKSVARLRALAYNEDYSELHAELDSIIWQVEHVHRQEKFIIQNFI